MEKSQSKRPWGSSAAAILRAQRSLGEFEFEKEGKDNVEGAKGTTRLLNLRRNQRKKTRFEIPRILAKYRRLAMHVKEMQPSVSVLDATDRELTQRIVASFIINLFKSLSESAQDFDSQQPFTRSPPFAPPLIRCARQGQAAAAARRLCAHVALVRSLT